MKTLVTGATGFLGGALARRLHNMGWDVTALGRNALKLEQLESEGIRTYQIDLTDKTALADACKDQEIVFHCAAFPSPWGSFEKFYQANVIGTRNVIHGCEEHKVKRLVYVSTPSLYFDYTSRTDVKETDALPEPISNYSATKILAEQELDEAFARGLATIAIRPRAIFGPGDTVIFPRLIPRLQSGRLPILGDGENIVDLTYIDNVVDALLLCAESPANTLGKKYNISNGEPIKIWKLIERLCDELQLPHPTRRISRQTAHVAASVLEAVYTMLPTHPEPPLTRVSVSMMANNTTLDISAARNELGYRPKVSVEEGVQRFLKWWKETNPSLQGR
ncbi:NAD-dependent epimerase/dehydratase family protein [Candidatus Villigracilis affinis]|uniref:NAD-dependent epimerase/dehydratase family protein n=1 Tax=Candidatus Villigracilis affinis TaxID=3140682 RepID=UPI001D206E4B|nr:NAD-dependent epimerase/dehydratase family protein [Anaerolineales bacterium]